MARKTCTQCKVEQDTSAFNKDRNRPDGLYPWCRACKSAKTRARRALFAEEERAKQRARYSANREVRKAQMRAHYAANAESHRHAHRVAHLRRTWGLTLEQYEEMLKAQDGVCAICGDPEMQTNYRTGKLHNLAVDHDHDTGKIRGLLVERVLDYLRGARVG